MAFIKRVAIASVILFVSCGREPSGSDLLHTMNQPVNDTYKNQWRVLSDDQYPEMLNASSILTVSAADIYPASNALTHRAQYWLDRADSLLRSRYGSAMQNIPKPIAKVIKAPNANAFVAQTPTCMSFSLTVEGNPSGATVHGARFDRGDRAIREVSNARCIATDLSIAEQKAMIQWWLQAFPDCTVSFKDREVVAAPSCRQYLGRFVADLRHADVLILNQTSHFITLQSPIFTALNESEFVSIVTHELGHYYKSHVTADGSLYSFFYRLGTNNISVRPVADPSVAALGQKILDMIRGVTPKDKGLMEQALKANLAEYTVEQEADELGAEWMTALGVDATYAIEAQLALAEISKKKTHPEGWIDPQFCRQYYKNGWKDERGQPVIVPVADWEDAHHSPCFRAFNLDREIKAHQYPMNGRPAQGPSPAWSSLPH